MGLHTGYCAVGNFGSEARMDYTILGGTVNLAARQESAAKPAEILISRETRAHLGHDLPCEPGGALEVRGVAYPVEIFKVGRTHERARVLVDTPHLLLRIDPQAADQKARAEARAALAEALRAMEDD